MGYEEDDTNQPRQELSETGVQIGIELDEDEGVIEPFDPSKITIEQKAVPMDTILRRLKQGTLILSPSFQRKEVWNDSKKSRLIESIMLNIPLPMFYVAEDDLGKWEVVDGLQRLAAIRNFLYGDKDGVLLKLKDLEFLSKRFDGKTFRAIESNPEDQKIVNTLLETEMRFTIINPGTPEAVKRNIFKRINTGGMPLTSQEIRHALYEGQSSDLLQEMVALDDFINAVGRRIDDSRMGASELILRLLSFMIMDRAAYKSGMDEWLSNAMRLINVFPSPTAEQVKIVFKDTIQPDLKLQNIGEVKTRFSLAMQRAAQLFKGHAFRKSLPGDERKSPVNKSLFEVWGNLLAEMPEPEFNLLLVEKERFFSDYEHLLSKPEFVNSISRHSSSQKGVIDSFQSVSRLIQNFLGHIND
ncbi:DUF262 domain-containing protein [Marinobacter sp. LV10MA510-1]|uniref:DUF262 domain-containing protein n=1 Tax=Marinobacter sp. LV10MA510-1 TaxID=1415567 RepID=UPI000BF981C8|nr:DUF262 domain-containing protein [Marinobacter sp. LV10MA510-1]PFG09262.1 uncharacterized protein DUF262 [Marinobacter sp. LV10MA510-1]